MSEPDHHETLKTIIEVCKASGINFAVMYSSNVDMSIKALHKDGTISKAGTYKEGTYFKLDDDERKAVDDMAEKICLSTRFFYCPPRSSMQTENKS